jgi:hypothetical protein
MFPLDFQGGWKGGPQGPGTRETNKKKGVEIFFFCLLGFFLLEVGEEGACFDFSVHLLHCSRGLGVWLVPRFRGLVRAYLSPVGE